jgi:hypothetical protein
MGVHRGFQVINVINRNITLRIQKTIWEANQQKIAQYSSGGDAMQRPPHLQTSIRCFESIDLVKNVSSKNVSKEISKMLSIY